MARLFQYAAFISYASADSRFAKRLHRALEAYRIPSALGSFDLLGDDRRKNRVYPVFRDREELSAGNLSERIEASLERSAALIVVCSPAAASSVWVQKEVEFFASLGRRDRIFAVVCDDVGVDEDHTDLASTCFPAALRADPNANLPESLAADARRGKDGFQSALLKIVAGMIGVSVGDIVNRDRRARRTRLARAVVLSFALVLLVGFGGGMAETFAMRDAMARQAHVAILEGAPLEAAPFALASTSPPNSLLASSGSGASALVDTGLSHRLLISEPARALVPGSFSIVSLKREFSFSPQGDVLTHIATDGRMHIWDATSGVPLFDVPDAALVNDMAWLDGGRKFVIQGMEGAFLIFNPDSRRWTFPLSYALPLEMTLSPSRQRMLAFASDGRATEFDLQREQRLARFPWFPSNVSSAAISNEGDRIAYVVRSGAGGIRDARGGVITDFASRTDGMWLSPDAELLAIRAAESYNISLYNFRTGLLLREFPTNAASYNLEFSSDSSRIVLHTLQQQTILWDLSRNTEVATIDGDMIAGFQSSFLANGSRIFLRTKSGLLREWSGRSGELVANWDWLGPVEGASFSADGNMVLVLRSDKSASLFDLVNRTEFRIVGAGVAETVALSPTGSVAAIRSRRDGILVLSLNNLRQSRQTPSVRACQQNSEQFRFVARRNASDATLSWHLLGRPANVCDWRGIGSWSGWLQWIEMWRSRLVSGAA